MKIEIQITIKPREPERFDKDELMADLKYRFCDVTGYEIDDINIEIEDDD